MLRFTSIGVVSVICGLAFYGCDRPRVQAAAATLPSQTPPHKIDSRIVRSTGVIQAVRTHTIRVPQLTQITQRNPQLTITALVPNGSAVKEGAILVEFDPTSQLDDARDAEAKLNDLEHQREEKRAQVASDSAKRLALIKEAEVDLGKAELQLQKGPVLADLERRKNEVKASSARERVASLNKSHAAWLKAEAAAVRVFELKCARQQLVVERLKSNIEKLTIHAPHDGMIALENVWRSGSTGPSQVGDQVYPNQGIVRIFDPSEMIVETQVNEPDLAVLGGMAHAKVFLDAYPNVAFQALLESASPVATAGLESPVKSFIARFHIKEHDARLLPDLSASIEIEIPGSDAKKGAL